MSPELDILIDRYFTTIPMNERMEAARAVARHVSDQVAWMGLFYQTDPELISNRLQNVKVSESSSATTLANVHEWGVR